LQFSLHTAFSMYLFHIYDEVHFHNKFFPCNVPAKKFIRVISRYQIFLVRGYIPEKFEHINSLFFRKKGFVKNFKSYFLHTERIVFLCLQANILAHENRSIYCT